MEVLKIVLSVIGIIYGLKWVLGGVRITTGQDGRLVGGNVILLQLAFVVIGFAILYFSGTYLLSLL